MNKGLFPSRKELERFEPYKPGLSIQHIKRQYGLKKVIKLASNENPRGPSPRALKAYRRVAKEVFRYPETKSIDLRLLLQERHRVDLDDVIIGAGSDDIIELLAKAFLTPQDSVVVSASAFIQYRIAANLMGATIITIPMKDMKHDLAGMAKSANESTKIVFVANPNNPTGTYNTKDEMEEFFDSLPAHVLPVIDEAYFEYAALRPDYPSVLKEFYRKRPVVVLRTFSKIYGLAGLRVGYGIGPSWVIEALDKIRSPFNVSVPAQAAAALALADTKFIAKSVSENESEKAKLTKELNDLGLPVIPSATNFILIKTEPWTGRFLFEQLLQRGVITRCVDEYRLPHYLRITVGTPAENKILLKAIREVIDSQ